jgi:hypothetical protein
MNCRCARSGISSVCNSCWSADPAAGGVVRGDLDGLAWIPPGDAIAVLLVHRRDRSVRLFLLEIADLADRRYLADVYLAVGFAAAAINIAMLPREGLAGMDGQIDDRWANSRSLRASVWLSGCFFIPWQSLEFVRQGDPIGGEAGYRAGRGRAGRSAKHGATGSPPRTTGPTPCCAGI